MKIARTIAYWVTTGLFSLALGASGIAYLSGAMDEAIAALGYPPSFLPLMGVLKILGAIALLIPALPRAKEWVYAGFVFNLVGAAWSHAYLGDLGGAVAPIVLGLLLVASYLLRPEGLWLGRSPWAGSASADDAGPDALPHPAK